MWKKLLNGEVWFSLLSRGVTRVDVRGKLVRVVEGRAIGVFEWRRV